MPSGVFMGHVLVSISDGILFKRVFSIILRVLSIIVALGSLYIWIRLWGGIFHLGGFFPSIGGIIFQIILLITIAMVTHVIWLRAESIAALPRADFTVIPIASILLKLVGEVYASVLVPLSIGGGIALWFGGGNLMYRMSYLTGSLPGIRYFLGPGSGSFLGGLYFMIGGVILSFLILVMFSLMAELLVVAVDIAKNLKITREIAEGYRK
jgi:hypothetical protein